MFTFEDDIEFDVYKPNHLEMILRKTYLHNSYVKIINEEFYYKVILLDKFYDEDCNSLQSNHFSD